MRSFKTKNMQTENYSSPLKKISFSTTIKASKEKVWAVLWNDESYKAWTSAFTQGSYAVSDWNEGSKILFLDAKGSGMYSTIVKKIPYEFMSFKHIGEVKENIEQPLNEKTQSWSGSMEDYILKETDGTTELTIEMDVVENFLDYFKKTFPVAIDNIKKLAEAKIAITVEATIIAPVAKVWEYWSKPEHITQWCNASPDWHAPRAENDLHVGGKFSTRMEAKDGSFGFDFGGVYDEVKAKELITYTLGDERKVSIHFSSDGNTTKLVETFEAEDENPVEMQKGGWQAILDNFKKYVETN
jgi:uncharacterized protein YndB with AHSA1/START domain